MATFLAMRRHMTALLVAGLLLGACGDDDDSGERAAVTSIPDDTTTSSTTTTEPRTVAPDVIPQDESQITEEYVERVLDVLQRASLESIVLARQEGLVDEPSLKLLEATSSGEVYERRVNDLLDIAASGFEGLVDEPRPLDIDVLEILDTSGECISVEVRADASGLIDPPPTTQPGQREFLRLYAAPESSKRSGLNKSAWVLDQSPVTFDGSVPDIGCSGS